MFVTTSINHNNKQVSEANYISKKLKIPYVERIHYSIETLFTKTTSNEALLVTKKDWRYLNKKGDTFFFHPNLSVLRINQLKKGNTDTLITTANVNEGDAVLDCTLGFGADSIVLAFIVGLKGKVVSLESQPIISTLVRHGLKTYTTGQTEVDTAMQRIEVINEEYTTYLQNAPDNSFDVVLFDPMFRHTINTSSAIQDLKLLANPNPVNVIAIKEAKRVARSTIVLKERVSSLEFERLGFTIRKKTSRYALGIIDVRDKDAY